MKVNKMLFEGVGEGCSIHLEPAEFKQFKDFLETVGPSYSMCSGSPFPFVGFLIKLQYEIFK